jgi:hypothetical protein
MKMSEYVMNQDEKRTICYFTYEMVNLKNIKGCYNYSDYDWELTGNDKESNETCLFKSGVAADVDKRVQALINKWRFNVRGIICAVECENNKIAKALEKSIRIDKEGVIRNQKIDENLSFADGTNLGNHLIEGWSRNAYSEWFVLYNKSEVNEIIDNMKLCGKELTEYTDLIL